MHVQPVLFILCWILLAFYGFFLGEREHRDGRIMKEGNKRRHGKRSSIVAEYESTFASDDAVHVYTTTYFHHSSMNPFRYSPAISGFSAAAASMISRSLSEMKE